MALDPEPWRDLISFRPALALQERLAQAPLPGAGRVLAIESGLVGVNLDRYPVLISRPPTVNNQLLRAEDLLSYVRLHFNDFLDQSIAKFYAPDSAQASLWSNAPYGAVMSFDMLLPVTPSAIHNNGDVLCSLLTPRRWVFSTLHTTRHQDHPVSGNREFVIDVLADGSWVFATRAADRVTNFTGEHNPLNPEFVFQAADSLWMGFQDRLAAFVNGHGGQATLAPGAARRTSDHSLIWAYVEQQAFRPTGLWLGQKYTVVDVSPDADRATAYCINGAGAIAGDFDRGGATHAFVKADSSSAPRTLDESTAGSHAHAVNAIGAVAGSIDVGTPENPATRAFVWSGGGHVDLGTLGGSSAEAYALNDRGQVAGESSLAGDDRSHASLWPAAGGAAADLGTLGGPDSAARAINNDGVVVGDAALAGGGSSHACRWTSGQIVDLGTLGGRDSSAHRLNAAGFAVGWSALASGGHAHACLWIDGAKIDLGALAGGTWSSALGVNDVGQVVGWSTVASGDRHAFVWRRDDWTGASAALELIDLNSLIPADSGWTLSMALSINNAGAVVGAGVTGGRTRAFLLLIPS